MWCDNNTNILILVSNQFTIVNYVNAEVGLRFAQLFYTLVQHVCQTMFQKKLLVGLIPSPWL